MTSPKLKIDEYVRNERFKGLRYWALIVVIGLVALWFAIPNTGKIEAVSGTTIRLIGEPTYGASELYLLVKLDSGEEVKVFIPSPDQYKINGRVRLQKQEPRILGSTTYRFRGFIENDT